MIELETQFVSGDGGFSSNPLTYTQLKRNEKAAVYMRSRNGIPYDYETFMVKVKPKGTRIFQKILEDDTECYPSSSQWGRVAWSFTQIGLAMAKFHDLSQNKLDENIIENESDSSNDVLVPVISVIPSEITDATDNELAEDKPYKGPTLRIPIGEFSTKELAEYNDVQYAIAFLFLKEQEKQGKIKFVRKERRATKGKPTSLFQLNNTP